jgi:class 3 adenylate cyclase
MDRGGAGALNMAIDAIRAHLDRGAPWDACDAFRAAAAAENDGELLYWGALAHARSGAARVAHALLERCAASSLSPALRVEALCLRGRLWKDAYRRGPAREVAGAALAHARAHFLQAYAIARGAYPGINAASLAMLCGDRDDAVALAGEVLVALDGRQPATPWDTATRAEAQVLTGDFDGAARSYTEACAHADANAGVVASMRRQLALLASAIPQATDLLALLRAPDVVAFAGHLIDEHGRGSTRFPAHLVPVVREALDRQVAAFHQPAVFTSAACGADLLFVEAALARRAEVNIVLPFARDDFVRSSVAAAGDEWVQRFDAALARASRVVMATEERHLGDDMLFDHAARLVEGLARLRAAQLETSASMLCVIDMESAGNVGGTRESYDRWKASGDRLDVVDLAAIRDGREAPPIRKAGSDPGSGPVLRAGAGRAWKALMFADFAGFSRVQDAFAPRFHERFLDLGARAIAQSRIRPLDAKTWGDALYAVFDTAEEAADFALRFLGSTLDGDWSDVGMPGTSRIRIALHAGPVYRGYDPVMQRDDYFGSSVTRAARIEPIAQPGTVYASEAFAATLAATRAHGFTLEYIGRVPLAKAYGESTIYRVDRA